MKTFLVTGANGYIGSRMIEKLQEKYPFDTVLGLDKTVRFPTSGNVWQANLESPAWYVDFKGMPFDAVFHLAASSNIDDCNASPFDAFQNNVLSLMNILDSHKCGDITIKNFIFASSAAVYKPNLDGEYDESDPLVDLEDALNVYGLSKAVGENILAKARIEYGLKYVALRFSNVVGASPYLGFEYDNHLLPNIVKAWRDRKILQVYGDEHQIRDYIHIDDICDAMIASYETMKSNPNVFGALNISSGTGHSIQHVLGLFNQQMYYEKTDRSYNSKTYAVPMNIVNPRIGDNPKLILQNDLAQKIISWKPKKTLKDAICDYK